MRTMNKFGAAVGLLAALALGGCADMNNQSNAPYGSAVSQGNAYAGYGVVQSIELVRQENSGNTGSSIGLGTIAGAVVGGIVGNQVGAGRGNTVATVAGAAGGAYVGHELENRKTQTTDAYKITVRMEDGSYQSLIQSSNANLRVGDRVRVENGAAQRY
jgi:outer membrane lipoprotein SlyB